MSAGIVLLCVAFKLLVFNRHLSPAVTILDAVLKTPTHSANRLVEVLERVRRFWSLLCELSILLVTLCALSGLYFMVYDDIELSVPMLRVAGTALLLWSAVVLLRVIVLQHALQATAIKLDQSKIPVEEPIQTAATQVSLVNGILLALHGFGFSLGVAAIVLWYHLR